jgi:hypothetical protein
MIFLSDGNRNALPAEPICIPASTVLSMIYALITTAVNRKRKRLDEGGIISIFLSSGNKQFCLGRSLC